MCDCPKSIDPFVVDVKNENKMELQEAMKAEKRMRILVTTPAGRIGSQLLRELLAPEFTLRVITPEPGWLPPKIQEQVEIVHGSTDDPATLAAALDGVEALFWCVPVESRQEKDLRSYYERFARAACDAIQKAGTERVVTISAAGKGLARDAGPISALHRMEDILNQSGAHIRHVRCAPLMENFLSDAAAIRWDRRISYPIAGNVPLPMAAASDVVEASLRWLVRRDWKDIQGMAVHGPNDLSLEQAARIIGAALERPVQYQAASAEDYIRRLMSAGASAEYALCRVEMFTELAHGITCAEPRTAESTTATTLAMWAEKNLVPLVESLPGESKQQTNLCKASYAQTI